MSYWPEGAESEIISGALENFANKCLFELGCDKEGQECRLRVSCQFQDRTGEVHTLERDIDLSPIISIVRDGIASYHAHLHGQDTVGWFGGDLYRKAARTAKSIAKSKAVKSLYSEAKKIDLEQLKAMTAALPPPYGPAATASIQAVQTGQKVYDTIKAAKDGNKTALEKVAVIKNLAAQGSPRAADVIAQMEAMLQMMKQKEAMLQGA
jgi:hypothetical protein